MMKNTGLLLQNAQDCGKHNYNEFFVSLIFSCARMLKQNEWHLNMSFAKKPISFQ